MTNALDESQYDLANSDKSVEKPGFDTLEEQAEKYNFFQAMEDRENGSLDYSQLNRELSASNTMPSPVIGAIMRVDDDDGVSARKPGGVISLKQQHQQPKRSDASSVKEASAQQKPSLLSKVSLLDSLDSTLNTSTSPQAVMFLNGSATSRDTSNDVLGQALPEPLKRSPETPRTFASGILETEVIGSNTSVDILELHNALKAVEMTPHATDSLLQPGMNVMVSAQCSSLSGGPTSRSVGQLLTEMGEVTARQAVIVSAKQDVKLMSDYRCRRSPRCPVSPPEVPGDIHSENCRIQAQDLNTNQCTVGVPISEMLLTKILRTEMTSSKSVAASHTPSPVLQVDKSSTPILKELSGKGRGSNRGRYNHVKSSGYGRCGLHLVSHRSDFPSDVSPIRPAERDERTVGALAEVEDSRPLQARQLDQSMTDDCQSQQATSPGDDLESDNYPLAEQSSQGSQLVAEAQQMENVHVLQQETKACQTAEYGQQHLEEELLILKQENFALSARLKDQKATLIELDKGLENADTTANKEFVRLQKECKEQEKLLAGFQLENQRLYEEMQVKESAAKATKEAMFRENERLNAEMVSIRSLLKEKDVQLRNKGIITSLAVQRQIAAGIPLPLKEAADYSDLEEKLRDCKKRLEHSLREMKIEQAARLETERCVEALQVECGTLMRQIGIGTQSNSDTIATLQRKHDEEIKALSRKLKWYVENQELLDKNANIIKLRDSEIHRLRIRVEDLRTETGRRMEEDKLRSKEKSADSRKIADLERQVKEMEQIVRRRHPNSLPALILAAGTVPDVCSKSRDGAGLAADVLEKRVNKLEIELEKKDEEYAVMLRAMEQKYNTVKYRFEDRVADLEGQLRQGAGGGQDDHTWAHPVALQQELDNARERYRREVKEVSGQRDRLASDLSKLRLEHKKLGEALAEKEQELLLAVEIVSRVQGGISSPINVYHDINKALVNFKGHEHDEALSVKSFSLVAEMEQRNQELINQVEILKLEKDHQRVNMQRSLAEVEASARCSREESESRMETLEERHSQEVLCLKADYTAYNSTSKMAHLHSRCDSQQVMLQYLQSQLSQKTKQLDSLQAVEVRGVELQKQVETLQKKLYEARRSQAPEMRHFESLEEKLGKLSEQYSRREQELETVLRGSHCTPSQDLVTEATKWRQMVDMKNLEICRFREELDAILNVLRELQRQGVKLPYVLPSS